MTDLSNPTVAALCRADPHAMTTRKVAVAVMSLLTTLVLTAGKLIIGAVSGSLALVADGLQGLVDILVTAVTLLVVAVSGRAPDPAWTCGRDKMEALAALAEALLLAVIAVCIWYLALAKLVLGTGEVAVEPWYIGAVLVAVVADYWRHLVIRRAARETASMALAANAAHFLTDSLASLAVMIGLIAVQFGFPLADTLATLVVAGFLTFTAIRVGTRAVNMLLDRVDPRLSLRALELLQADPRVCDVQVLRLRRMPNELVVDAMVRAAIDSQAQADALRDALDAALRASLGPVRPLIAITAAPRR